MLIIEHRRNKKEKPEYSDCAEIDVQVITYGFPVVKHSASDDNKISLMNYLGRTEYERFFVDIKQNLSVAQLTSLLETFEYYEKEVIGLFDVPYPSLYYASKAGLPVYQRISEFESSNFKISNKFWLDPLVKHGPRDYERVLLKIEKNRHASWEPEIIIACPSLHGEDLYECETMWDWLKRLDNKYIKGIVTKELKDCWEVFNEAS